MPGPVSQSNPGPPDLTMREAWQKEIDAKGLKYFVIKIEDLFDALDDEEIECFNYFLRRNEQRRVFKGKKPFNEYWVVNRDEGYAGQVKRIIEKNENISLPGDARCQKTNATGASSSG